MAISIRRDAEPELGAELHDRVIGNLSALILDMERFKRDQYNRASVRTAVDTFQDSMRQTLGELRDIVSSLQGGAANRLEGGLVEAVRKGPLAELHRQTGAATNILASPQFPRRLDAFIETQLYRIVAQAIRNAAQHSGAERVTVAFRAGSGCYVIEVIDDGCGYDWAERYNGQGTMGMRQRAELIGAELEFNTDSGGRGTIVRIRVQGRGWR
jgi:signal transduction histidine kinase